MEATLKTGTKTQFFILLLLGAFIYNFWLEIAISVIHIYAISGHPHSKRLLGEYYATQANEATIKSAFYFQQALAGYKISLPGSSIEHRKWIEYLIGNQYECGKGVEPNLAEAKIWYQKAIKSGLPSGKNMFENITESLRNAKLNEQKNVTPSNSVQGVTPKNNNSN
jgi:hypothetical protein